MKLKHIGEFIINPASIAYMETWVGPGGFSKGTAIYFNAYGTDKWTGMFEMPVVRVSGIAPTQIMDFINDEPPF